MRTFAQAIGVAVLLGVAGPALAAPDRVLRAPDDAELAPVRGSVHPLARADRDLGPVDPATRIEGAAVVFSRTAEQQRALEALLAAQQDRASPRYRRWLTPEEYADSFGLSRDDVARVVAWLRSKGFAVAGANRSRTRVTFGGTLGQVESALRTEMRWYDHGGERRFANATELSVPAALSGVVMGFANLDSFRPRPLHVVEGAAPDFTSSISGRHFLAPEDFAVIYHLAPLYAAGLDGSGQAVAVAGQTEVDLADIRAFRSASNLPAKDPQLVLVPNSGSPTVRSSDLAEADLDLEWAGAVARNADVLYVYTGSSSNMNVLDALTYAVDNDVAPVLSLSYGICEADIGAAGAQSLQHLMQQANSQGQTLAAASGDAGPADCDSASAASASRGYAVDIPASIPEVTGVGGTEFVDDVANPAAYWSAANDASSGSALSYIPEGVWNESSGSLAASGGGASTLFAKPAWQAGAGVPADGKRDVPDLALNAAAGHDGYLICTAGSCVNGYRAADSTLKVVGGTSAGTPSFAGILAIVNQATGARGQGNVNPTLYGLAATSPAAFHAVSTGDNLVPCAAGSAGCPASGQIGFAASGGYSEATGLGSIDAEVLVASWPGNAPATTSTAVTSSSAAAPVGATVTLVATVSPAAGGTPAGTVQFAVDGHAFGAPVALSGGAARMSTSLLAVGSHAVVATYSGSATFLASTSPPFTETITDYTLAPSPASLEMAVGASGTASVAVVAVGPFGGTVSLSCAAPAPVRCSLSPPSVLLGGAVTSASATLTVTAGARTSLAAGRGAAGRFALGGAALLAAGAALGKGPRRRRPGLLAAALLGLSAGAGAGCGGGTTASAATPGSYTVTVSATSGSLAHSVALPVVVVR